jgi:hypothetical protein
MARVNFVQKARKAQGTCGRGGCDRLIEAGDSYYHWANFRGPKKIRCADHRPRASETAGSDKIGRLYGAQESIEDGLGEWNGEDATDAAQIVRDAAETAKEVQEEYQEALDAWEHGNEQLQEYVDNVEAWVDELEDAANDIENMEPEPVECGECAGTGVKVDDDEEPIEPEEQCPVCKGSGEVPDTEAFQNDVREAAESVSGNLSL